MCSQFVFVLQTKIKRAAPLLVNVRVTGHMRCHFTDVLPQPNSPPDYVFRTSQSPERTTLEAKLTVTQVAV